ncbi:Hypothetical protein, putative [Bodo saltans]|uniref:RING-type domain-containing protein n=1 Tax=Bodo saltans TaxID=75058 RepID=A0A0S4ISL3_BODSA|nr:Hypothetical protein, putative [Bodo saltans]|eukprot:CUF27580.1 Hypothetical protein, putative [Bodo saltans]
MELPETFLCCVCLEAMVHAVSLMPCHDTICTKCAHTIIKSEDWSSRCCPLCRSRINTIARDESFSTVVRSFLDFVGKWKLQQHVHSLEHDKNSDNTNISSFQKQSLVEGLVKTHLEQAALCCLSEDALRALITLEWNEQGYHDGTLADRLRGPPLPYQLDCDAPQSNALLTTTPSLPLDESDPGKRYVGRLSAWNGIYGRIRGKAFQSQFDFVLPTSEILFFCSDLDLDFNDEESVCSFVVSFRVERISNMGPHWEWRAYDVVFLGPDTAVGLYAQHSNDDDDPRALIENVVVDPTLPGVYHICPTGIRLEGDLSPTSQRATQPREVVFRLFTSKREGDGGIVGEALCWLEPRWKSVIPVAVKHSQGVGKDSEDDCDDDSYDDNRDDGGVDSRDDMLNESVEGTDDD